MNPFIKKYKQLILIMTVGVLYCSNVSAITPLQKAIDEGDIFTQGQLLRTGKAKYGIKLNNGEINNVECSIIGVSPKLLIGTAHCMYYLTYQNNYYDEMPYNEKLLVFNKKAKLPNDRQIYIIFPKIIQNKATSIAFTLTANNSFYFMSKNYGLSNGKLLSWDDQADLARNDIVYIFIKDTNISKELELAFKSVQSNDPDFWKLFGMIYSTKDIASMLMKNSDHVRSLDVSGYDQNYYDVDKKHIDELQVIVDNVWYTPTQPARRKPIDAKNVNDYSVFIAEKYKTSWGWCGGPLHFTSFDVNKSSSIFNGLTALSIGYLEVTENIYRQYQRSIFLILSKERIERDLAKANEQM